MRIEIEPRFGVHFQQFGEQRIIVKRVDARPDSVKTVRELSGAGPCITLGIALRETAWRISYRDRHARRNSATM